jgi:hypothetical protein
MVSNAAAIFERVSYMHGTSYSSEERIRKLSLKALEADEFCEAQSVLRELREALRDHIRQLRATAAESMLRYTPSEHSEGLWG